MAHSTAQLSAARQRAVAPEASHLGASGVHEAAAGNPVLLAYVQPLPAREDKLCAAPDVFDLDPLHTPPGAVPAAIVRERDSLKVLYPGCHHMESIRTAALKQVRVGGGRIRGCQQNWRGGRFLAMQSDCDVGICPSEAFVCRLHSDQVLSFGGFWMLQLRFAVHTPSPSALAFLYPSLACRAQYAKATLYLSADIDSATE
jgi:hypothetical protein